MKIDTGDTAWMLASTALVLHREDRRREDLRPRVAARGADPHR